MTEVPYFNDFVFYFRGVYRTHPADASERRAGKFSAHNMTCYLAIGLDFLSKQKKCSLLVVDISSIVYYIFALINATSVIVFLITFESFYTSHFYITVMLQVPNGLPKFGYQILTFTLQ